MHMTLVKSNDIMVNRWLWAEQVTYARLVPEQLATLKAQPIALVMTMTPLQGAFRW
jgi:hypothetical protein